MITAALISFVVLLIAWIVAPDGAEATDEAAVLQLPESERIAA